MKTRFLLITCMAIASVLSASAQDSKEKKNSSGLALSIGASTTYYYGLGSRNFDKFENERVNWQMNGMLGITVARDKGGRRTMLAAFGNYGFNNRSTISQLFKDQGYVAVPLFTQSTSNNFYQYEAGLVVADVLRFSTGMGQQNFKEQALLSPEGVKFNATVLKYYSSTVGLNLNLASVAVILNCNFAYGKDFKKTVLTPSAGLMLRF